MAIAIAPLASALQRAGHAVISFGEDEKGEMYLLTVAGDGKGIFGLAKK